MTVPRVGHRELVVGALAGVIHVGVLLVVLDTSGYHSRPTLLELVPALYLLAGAFLVAAIPTVLVLRRVYLPMVCFVVVFVVAMYFEWRAQLGPYPPMWSVGVAYAIGWIVLLPIYLGVGHLEARYGERVIRNSLRG